MIISNPHSSVSADCLTCSSTGKIEVTRWTLSHVTALHLLCPHLIFPSSLWSEQMCAFHLRAAALPPISCRSCTIRYLLSPESSPSASLLSHSTFKMFNSPLSTDMNKNFPPDLISATSHCSFSSSSQHHTL